MGREFIERIGRKMNLDEKWIELWATVYDYSAYQHCKEDVSMEKYDLSYRAGFNDALDWVINHMNTVDGEE